MPMGDSGSNMTDAQLAKLDEQIARQNRSLGPPQNSIVPDSWRVWPFDNATDVSRGLQPPDM